MKIKILPSIYKNINFWCKLSLLIFGIFITVFVMSDILKYTKIPTLYILLCAILGIILISIFYHFPEISFALFLTSGFFKADPKLQNFLPKFFDLTIFFGTIVILFILYKILKKKLKIPKIPSKLFLPYIILVVLIFISLFYTQAPIYGWDKFLRFITITTLTIFAPMFLFVDIKKFHRFLYTLVVISSLMVINSIISSFKTPTMFHTAFGSDYLALGYITGIVSLIIIYYFLLRNDSLKMKFLWFLFLGLNFFGLLYNGGRAPVIAFFVTIIILAVLSLAPKIKINQFKIIKIASCLVLLGIVLFIFTPQPFSTLFNRIKVFFTQEEGGRSVAVRLDRYNSAIKAFTEKPVRGLGLGGFSVYHLNLDQRYYPHNMFLEIGSEVGIIGLTALLFLLGFCFFYLLKLRKKYKRQEKYYLIITILSLFIFMFLNSCVSGDINDNRTFFVWIGVAYALNNIFIYSRNQKLNNFRKIQ